MKLSNVGLSSKAELLILFSFLELVTNSYFWKEGW